MDEVDHLEFMNSLTQTFSVLADTKHPVYPLALYVLSDLDPEEVEKFQSWWLLHRPLTSCGDHASLAGYLRGEARPYLRPDCACRLVDRSPSGEVRAEAIPNPRDDPSADLMNILIQVMQHDPSQSCRAAAVRGLGKYVSLYETDDLPLKQKATGCRSTYESH